jgi:hypothetical protein
MCGVDPALADAITDLAHLFPWERIPMRGASTQGWSRMSRATFS